MHDPRAKELQIRIRAASPSPAELAAINERFALEPLAAEQLYCRQIALCNDQVDRTGERFPRAYLERFAATLPGKPLLFAHDKQTMPLGRFYATEVTPDDQGVTWLQSRFYVVRTPANEEARTQIDGGVYSHASVGFRWADLLCDLCGLSYLGRTGEDYCPHIIGRDYNGRVATATYGGDLATVEAIEGSLVYLGAQYGAAVTKTEEQPTAARGGTELEQDGAAYRHWLRSESLRLATCLGAQAEARLILDAAQDAPAAKLLSIHALYLARFDAEFQPATTSPQNPGAASQIAPQ